MVIENKFKCGDTVVFDPKSFNPNYWNRLSKEEKSKYYGHLHNDKDPILFTFLCHHQPQHGHCTLINMDTNEVLVMCHTGNFRLATEEEC